MKAYVMHKVDADIEAGIRPAPELMQRIGALVGENLKSGKMIDGAGLGATSKRARVVTGAGGVRVERGPLVGAHEPMAGLAMISVPTFDDAIVWGRRVGEALGQAEVEVGPVVEPWDLGFVPMPKGPVPVRALLLDKRGDGREDARSEEEVRRLDDVTAAMKAAGVLLAAQRLEPTSQGARLRLKDGKRAVIDGPFAESKELVAGYSLLQVADLKEAIAMSWEFAELFDEIEIDVRVLREG